MTDPSRTNQELIEENDCLKKRIRELEQAASEYKQTAETLRESMENFCTFFSTVDDMIIIGSPDSKIVYTNPAMTMRLGYSTDELKHMHILDLHPAEMRQEAEVIFAAMFSGGPAVCPLPLQSKAGVLVPVETRAWFGRWSGAGYIFGICKDLTREQEALQKFNRLFNSNPVPMAVSSVPEDRFTDVNDAFLNVLGFTRSEVIGRTSAELGLFIQPEKQRKVAEELQANGHIANCELKVKSKDGTILDGVFSGELIDNQGQKSFLTVMIDQTERKRAAEALQDHENKYRLIAENMADVISILDMNLRYTYVSPSIKRVRGFTVEEAMAQTIDQVLTPESLQTALAAFAEEIKLEASGTADPNRVRIMELEEYTKSGSLIWLEISLSYMRDKDGKPVAILALNRDITRRKRVEEALRGSENRYRNIFNNAIEGIFQATPEGRYHSINPAFAAMFGYESPEAMKSAISNIGELLYVNPEDRKRLIEMMHVSEGKVREFEVQLRRKDGSKIWVSINARMVNDASKESPYLEGTCMDITERKQAAEALRQSEATLRSVFKATPIGLCIMKDRVYLNANKAWYDIFGYAESDMIGHTTRLLYENEAEYERVGSELYTSLLERGLASVQTRLKRKDGVFRDAIVIAAPLQPEDLSSGTVVAIQDITDYKQVVEELRENRRQLADIIEFLPDATFVIDKEGKVIAWNRAIEAMTGIRKEEMLGKGDYEYALPFYGDRRPIIIDLALHPDREMEKKYTAIQRMGDTLFGESFTPALPPGDIHLSATASVLRDSKGDIIAAIECIRDNTERKRMEERLNRAEKMEALGTLAGGVAHDLNNVLGILVGYSELLLEKLPESGSMRQYAGHILQSGMRGAAIIQDLLTLARRGVNVSEVIDLNKVVFGYLKTPEFENLRSYHPQVKIRTDLEEGLLNIKGSPVHLDKTIMNLVANAAEAISGGGEVTIRTENRYLDQPIRGYDEMAEGDYAVLTVSDTGRGISANDLGKIFEPFYTKKVMGRSGTGLGLAVVWGTVKDHRGYIDVQSEEGNGSTFTLYFPVTREEMERAEKAISPVAYMGKGESILVVDDVKEQRELATSMLVRLGYRVESVASGEAAIEYLKNKKADLVVLDMIMEPGMDGMETYRRILEITPGQKAVIVSGFSKTDRVEEAQEMGAGAFVRKPYILEKIGLEVRKELDGIQTR